MGRQKVSRVKATSDSVAFRALYLQIPVVSLGMKALGLSKPGKVANSALRGYLVVFFLFALFLPIESMEVKLRSGKSEPSS